MIRTTEPVLTPKTRPKRRKPLHKYKFNIKQQNAKRPYIYVPYAQRTDTAANLKANKKYKKKVRQGKTPRQRALHKVFKRDALRAYNKKHGNMKVCTRCHSSKAVSDFDWQKDGRKQRRPYCFICRKEMNAEAYQKRKKEGYYDT